MVAHFCHWPCAVSCVQTLVFAFLALACQRPSFGTSLSGKADKLSKPYTLRVCHLSAIFQPLSQSWLLFCFVFFF